ncbi:DUF1942 domain-containing protein [Mycolicibacterium sp. GF69]|uniref:DUF1942 domain-containing protein n=1 Tax=Mycolicibacterium sp. GF69 TaxID=2267251 RepID=UPI00352A395B
MNGAVTPIIPNFQAVSRSGVRYPSLCEVRSLNGIPSTTLAEGHHSQGLYLCSPRGTPTITGRPQTSLCGGVSQAPGRRSAGNKSSGRVWGARSARLNTCRTPRACPQPRH